MCPTCMPSAENQIASAGSQQSGSALQHDVVSFHDRGPRDRASDARLSRSTDKREERDLETEVDGLTDWSTRMRFKTTLARTHQSKSYVAPVLPKEAPRSRELK